MQKIILKKLKISGIYCEVANPEFTVPDGRDLKVRDVMNQLMEKDFRFELETDFGDFRDQHPTSMSWTVTADQWFFDDNFSVPENSYKLNSGVCGGVYRFFKYTVFNRQMQIVSGDSMAIPFGHPASPTIESGFTIHWDLVEHAVYGYAQKVHQ